MIRRAGGERLSEEDRGLIEELLKVPDSKIDYSNSPKLTGRFAAERIGVQSLFKPIKQQITLRLDGDIIAWARRDGEGYQSRINLALRKAMLDDLRAEFTKHRN